jgi:hypothetical protein
VVSWFKNLFSGDREPTEAELLLSARDNFMASQEASDAPWALFEIRDFPADGQIKVEFNWNDAFIKRINALGFQGETAEDAVQLFFYTSQMRPESLAGGDEVVQADGTPNLSSPTNRMVS